MIVTAHARDLEHDVAENTCSAVLLDAAEVAEHGKARATGCIHLELSRRLKILLDEKAVVFGVVCLRVFVRIEFLHGLGTKL